MKFISKAESQSAAATAVLEQFAAAAASSDPSLYLATLANNKSEIWLARFRTQDDDMLALKDQVRKLVTSRDPVLITGPSGTGKELLARALHGIRHESDFYHVNCGGMPEGLIESELFGHAAGAFTGANRDNHGIFRAAADGTIFLDEIGEAPLHLQAKLLTALQPNLKGEYTIRPVGSTTYIKVSPRIIAASKQDLLSLVKAGTFREDLYGRLMTHEFFTTPLSQRPNDILLILKFLEIEPDDSVLSELNTPYWQERLQLFNVRALQSYAKRKLLRG